MPANTADNSIYQLTIYGGKRAYWDRGTVNARHFICEKAAVPEDIEGNYKIPESQ